MNDFDFWYAYFDSLFLKPKPTPHISFIKTINLKYIVKLPFPECKKLPQLSRYFQEFQKFLFNQLTWIEYECEHSALRQSEQNINLIAILINIEKKYGQQYWHLKRRVQASICHFFSLFVFFLLSLIPNSDTVETLQTLQVSNKLCTSLRALQQLVNCILPQMNEIIKYLYQQSFAQQKKLTILFLQQIKQILLNLPSLNKKKFKHQFQLSKYLYVIVPIQLSKNQYKFKTKRKKTYTISNDNQIKYHSDQTLSQSTKKQSHKYINSQQIKKRLSLPKLKEIPIKDNFRTKIRKPNHQKEKSIGQSDVDKNSLVGQQTMPIIFQFSQKLRKYSFYLAQKKITKATFYTHQTGQNKGDIQKYRKKSDFGKTSGSRSKQKEFGRTYSIQKHRHLTTQTIRSKKSSFHRAHRKIVIEQSQKHRHHKQKSLARSKRCINLTTNEIINKPVRQIEPPKIASKRLNIYSGQTKYWGIVQQQINKTIIHKKINELIHSKFFQ